MTPEHGGYARPSVRFTGGRGRRAEPARRASDDA